MNLSLSTSIPQVIEVPISSLNRPHLFFVQLRSLEDQRVLPGITIGEIGVLCALFRGFEADLVVGPKAMGGYNAVDNGYARFDHVRIPREQMLSAFASVTPGGEYVKPPHSKLSYGGVSGYPQHL